MSAKQPMVPAKLTSSPTFPPTKRSPLAPRTSPSVSPSSTSSPSITSSPTASSSPSSTSSSSSSSSRFPPFRSKQTQAPLPPIRRTATTTAAATTTTTTQRLVGSSRSTTSLTTSTPSSQRLGTSGRLTASNASNTSGGRLSATTAAASPAARASAARPTTRPLVTASGYNNNNNNNNNSNNNSNRNITNSGSSSNSITAAVSPLSLAPSTQEEEDDLLANEHGVDVHALVDCPICSDFIVTATETPCCHSLFCRACLEDWKLSNPKCPMCRKPINLAQCEPNIPIQRFIDSLPLDCPFKLSGCTAKPPRSELEKHKQLCSFRPEVIEEQKKKKIQALTELRLKTVKQLKKFQETQQVLSSADKKKQGEEVVNSIIELGGALLGVAKYKKTKELLEAAVPITTELQGENSVLLAECLRLQAQLFAATANYDDSAAASSRALQILRNLGLVEKQCAYLRQLGNTYLKQAKYTEATETYNAKKCSEYDRAEKIYSDAMKIINFEDPGWPEVALNLADVHRKKGSYKVARDLYLKSLRKLEVIHGQNHPQIAEVCNSLGMLYKKEGQYNEAARYYRIALKIAQHFFGKQHPSLGMYLTNLGDIYRKQGDFTQAENTYHQAIAKLQNSLGPDHVEVAEVLNSMGLVLKKRGDYDAAEGHYTRAISIVENTFGEKHYKMGVFLNNLADIDRKRGRYEQALVKYKKALAAIEATLGPTHSEAAEILHNMGLTYYQLENYVESLRLFQSALDIVVKEFSNQHYKVGMIMNSFGLSHAMMRDYPSALSKLKQARTILIACLGAQHIEVADCFMNLGDVCLKVFVERVEESKSNSNINSNHDDVDKLAEAEKYYQSALQIVAKTFGVEHSKHKQLSSLLFVSRNYTQLAVK